MANFVLLQAWSGDIGNLRAGTILDDTNHNVTDLIAAGASFVPVEDGMGPLIQAFNVLARNRPELQLMPILKAGGFMGGDVFTLSADTVLDDTHSGGVIFTDTSGGARSHTIPTTVSAGWNAVFVREGANALNIIGDGTMLMAGPAAAANAVAIAVDNGGVSVIRRSATKCWCAGVVS